MKLTKTFLLLITGLFITMPDVKGQCVSDTTTIYSYTYGDSNYEIVKENKTWVEASACAVERGGKLAEISTQEEQDTLFYHINQAGIIADSTVAPDGGNASYLWLGGNDITEEGKWVWNGNNNSNFTQFWQGTTTGNVVDGLFNNWGNEPDDWNGQDGLGIAFTNWPLGVAGQWNDVDETNKLYYIIEYYHGTTSITESSKKYSNFTFYPNPGIDKITIVIGNDFQITQSTSLGIYDISGKLLLKNSVTTSKFEVDIAGFPTGAYVIALESENEKIAPQKLSVVR